MSLTVFMLQASFVILLMFCKLSSGVYETSRAFDNTEIDGPGHSVAEFTQQDTAYGHLLVDITDVTFAAARLAGTKCIVSINNFAIFLPTVFNHFPYPFVAYPHFYNLCRASLTISVRGMYNQTGNARCDTFNDCFAGHDRPRLLSFSVRDQKNVYFKENMESLSS